jgi:hypothetical protein
MQALLVKQDENLARSFNFRYLCINDHLSLIN